jgi:sugar lactone lactonase YvrE
LNQGKFISWLVAVSFFLSLSPNMIPHLVNAEEKNSMKMERIIGLSKEPGVFRNARGLAVAKDGTIFIGDTGESQIEVYDANYKYLRTIGSLGFGKEQFQWIQSIHLDEDGRLYVMDRFLECMKVFNKEGVFIREFTLKDNRKLRFEVLIDFAFLSSGEILVIEVSYYSRVYTMDGKFVRDMEFVNTKETSNGITQCVTIDPEGNIWIGDYFIVIGEYRFSKFNQSGQYLGDFLIWKSRDKYDSDYPLNLCIVGDDLYFSDKYSLKKYKLIEKGTEPATFMETIADEVKGVEDDETSVASVSGLVCVMDTIYYLDSLLNRLVTLSPTKELLGTIDFGIKEYDFLYPNNIVPTHLNFISSPVGVTIGPDNLFYVTNRNQGKVSVYNAEGEEKSSIGKPALGKKKQLGELTYPSDVAVNRDGFVFVSDGYLNRDIECSIEVFDPAYKPFMSIPISSDFYWVMDFDYQGRLVLGSWVGNIAVYDLSQLKEKIVTRTKSYNSRYLFNVADIVVDQDDNLIFSTGEDGMIYWINPDGRTLKTIGNQEDSYKSPIQFPSGICLDGKENLYVVDQGFVRESSLKKFSPRGKLIVKSDWMWCGLSLMTMDSKGLLYVTDSFHHVILVISDSTAAPPLPKDPTLIVSQAEFTFSVDTTVISEQDTFTLSVKVDKLEHTSSIDLIILFPKDLLTFVSCSLGNLLAVQAYKVPKTDIGEGFIIMASNSYDRREASGTGVLFTVKLKAKRSGFINLEFGEILLKNTEGKEVSFAGKKVLSLEVKPRDTVPPSLKINKLPDIVYKPTLYIEGETEPDATVTIREERVPVNSDGTFETTIVLEKGLNNILVEATDRALNTTKIILTVTLRLKTIIKLTIGSKTIIIDNKPSVLESEPYIDKGSNRTMVPLRAIGEPIGARIEYNMADLSVTVLIGSLNVMLWIGKPTALVNGKECPIDPQNTLSPVIVKGRTFLPLRFIAESFEFKVDWEPKAQSITLTYPKG